MRWSVLGRKYFANFFEEFFDTMQTRRILFISIPAEATGSGSGAEGTTFRLHGAQT